MKESKEVNKRMADIKMGFDGANIIKSYLATCDYIFAGNDGFITMRDGIQDVFRFHPNTNTFTQNKIVLIENVSLFEINHHKESNMVKYLLVIGNQEMIRGYIFLRVFAYSNKFYGRK